MCACSMGLIISRPCRQNRWCQSCVRGWLPHWDHNRSSWNNPVRLNSTGWFHDGLVFAPHTRLSVSLLLYLNHDGEDQRLAVEFFEDIAFGNVTDYSPDVYPVCDSAFLIGKRFGYFFL